MTNKEKFEKIFEETFGVSAHSVLELECTCEDKCPHDDFFPCIECEYDARNFWKKEYKERGK